MSIKHIKPRNPYIAGRALDGPEGFFGRKDIIDEILVSLSPVEQKVFVLAGQRRIGKTSILLQLKHQLQKPQFVPIYLDLAYLADTPLGQLLHHFASTIASNTAKRTKINVPPATTFDNELYFRQDFLPSVFDAIGDEYRLVLLLDEFDVLDFRSEQGQPTPPVSACYSYLGKLVESEARLSFVFVVGRKIENLSIGAMQIIRTARHKRISVLDKESASALILMAERQNFLKYTPEAVAQILSTTSGHPFFTQLMCQILFDRAISTSKTGSSPTVMPEHVKNVIPTVLESGAAALEWIWDSLPPAERVIFSAVAEGTTTRESLNRDQIFKILESHGLKTITYQELSEAPERLVGWDILKRVDGGYACFVKLMHQWAAKHKPLNRIKVEMDRIVPEANIMYQSATQLYKTSSLGGAIDTLKLALKSNPRHLQARLMLAKILRQKGKLPEAIKEYEQAYQQDPVGYPRYELVDNLKQFANEQDHKGKEDEALEQVDRALEISPEDRESQAIRSRIWERRGKKAQDNGKLEEALNAFTKAGAHKEVKEVERLIRQRERDALAERGSTYETEENWSKATEVYTQLREMDPDNDKWGTAIERIKKEIWRRKRDAVAEKGATYEAEEDWSKAAEVYTKLREMDPDNDKWVTAIERIQKKIWRRERDALAERGTTYETEEKWSKATKVFKQLQEMDPDNDKWGIAIERIQKEIWRRKRDALAERGTTYETEEKWSKATEVFKQLRKMDPDNDQWVTAMERTQEEEPLSLLYRDGLVAVKEQNWFRAQKILVDLINQRPGYKDAARILATVIDKARNVDLSEVGSLLGQTQMTIKRVPVISTRQRLGRGWVSAVTWSPDGKLLGIATGTGIYLYLYSADLFGIEWARWEHDRPVNDLAFSRDAKFLVSAGVDGNVRLFSIDQQDNIQVLQGHSAPVNSIVFSPEDQRLASCAFDGTIRIWQIHDRSLLQEIPGKGRFIMSVAFSPDGKLLAYGGDESLIRLHEISVEGVKKHVKETLSGHTDWIQCLDFHKEGRLLASGSDDGTIRIWDVKSGKPCHMMSDHTRRVNCVAFSPDGSLLASGSDDCTVRIWDVESSGLLNTLSVHNRRVNSVAFSPDQSILSSGSDDGTVLLFG